MFSHLLKYNKCYKHQLVHSLRKSILALAGQTNAPYIHKLPSLQLHHLVPYFLNNSHSTYHTANLKHISPIIHIAIHVKTTDLKQTLENPLVALLILMFNASHFLKEWICICRNVLDILHFEGPSSISYPLLVSHERPPVDWKYEYVTIIHNIHVKKNRFTSIQFLNNKMLSL